MTEVMDRCPTGIKGFDKLSKGGFIRDSDNLIVGGPGSGKSTFLLQFLWNGVTKFNENGLYCSFEPDIVETLDDSMSYGWDFSKLSADGRIKFMRFSPGTDIDALKSELTKIISKNDIKRICFDPISVLALNQENDGTMRQKIFDISSLMKRLKVTTLFADESLEGEGIENSSYGDWTRTDILKFLSDSVTLFYDFEIEEGWDRSIRIAKMRRTNHLRKPIGMRVTSRGIEASETAFKNLEEDRESVGEIPEVPETVRKVEVSEGVKKNFIHENLNTGMNVSEKDNSNSEESYPVPIKNEVRIAKPISEQEYFARNEILKEKDSSGHRETSGYEEPAR